MRRALERGRGFFSGMHAKSQTPADWQYLHPHNGDLHTSDGTRLNKVEAANPRSDIAAGVGSAAPRIHALDALRGIAAIGVVLWHYGAHFQARPLYSLLYPFYHSGFLLVDFFFVLSGYVISRSYWSGARATHFTQNVWARCARLYPLHLVTLLATAFLVWFPSAHVPALAAANNDTWHFLLNVLLLNNVGFQEGWSFNTPAWSISTEFIVNIAFLGFIAANFSGRFWMGGLALSALLVAGIASDWEGLRGQRLLGYVDVNLVRCVLGFASGVMVHKLVGHRSVQACLPTHGALATLCGCAALGGLGWILWSAGPKPAAVYYLASIIASVGVVAFVPLSRFLGQWLSIRPLTFLGNISYSVYLTHYPLQLLLYASLQLNPAWMDLQSWTGLAAYLALVLGISWMSYRYLELPAQKRLRALHVGGT